MYSISIIIPIYNVEKYIERCILSVMNQRDYDGEIECVLVDDCSPDRSMQLAQTLIESYQGPIRFQILHNQNNQGLSCSRNNGLSCAKGDYIFFLDSDDHISKDCIQSLSRQLYLYDGEIDIVIGNSFEYRNGKYWQERGSDPSILRNHTDIMRRFLQIEIPMMAWNKLIRRQFLVENHLLFEPQMVHEDELWSFQLYDVVQSVVLISDVTYIYEQHANSIMTSSAYFHRRIEAFHILVHKMLDSLGNRELYVEKFFWGIHMYMLAEDMIYRSEQSRELVDELCELRSQMIYRTVRDGRISIFFLLLLTIMPPCAYLVRFSWFRHKYHVMTSLFKKLALAFDFVHLK